MRRVLIAAVALLVIGVTFAANDPGHDSLYVEETGDSNLTGSLNISNDLQVANRVYSAYLDIIGNGTVAGGSQHRILGLATNLVIESQGDIVFNDQIGTSNQVRIGGGSSDNVNLNVTGDIYVKAGKDITVGGTSVCLANGTNCIGGNNTGNVSSVTAGDGLDNSGSDSDPILDINTGTGLEIDSDTLRLSTGAAGDGLTGGGASALAVGAGNGITVSANAVAIDPTYTQRRVSSTCSAGQAIEAINQDGTVNCTATGGGSTGAGWSNSTTQVYLTDATDDLNVSNTIFVDSSENRVGINDTTPSHALDVTGSIAIGGSIVINASSAGFFSSGSSVDSSLICTPANGLCNQSATSEATVEGYVYDADNALASAWNVTSDGTYDIDFDTGSLFIDTSNNFVGVNTTSPNATLHVASGGQSLSFDTRPANEIQINSTGNTNISITADGGSVIITLG